MVNWESRGWAVRALCCCNKSSLFCWIAGLCRWSAFFKNTGQTPSKWGHAAQNQEGILPVGAVETKYPRAKGCCKRVPTSSACSDAAT